jgi:transposase-like protein
MVVARRHRISESLLYNWRSAWRAAARVGTHRAATPIPFRQLRTDRSAARPLPPPKKP